MAQQSNSLTSAPAAIPHLTAPSVAPAQAPGQASARTITAPRPRRPLPQPMRQSAPSAAPAASAPAFNGVAAPTAETTGQFSPGQTEYGAMPGPLEMNRFDPGQFDSSRYEGAALSNAMRSLQPGMDSQDAAFRQRMVNQGLQEGSEGWDRAYANMSRSQNDLKSKAAFDAMGFGLGAQAQDFGQNLAANQANNAMTGQEYAAAMQQSQIGDNRANNQFAQGLATNQQNANINNQNFGQNLASAQFGQSEQARQFGQQFGYDQMANTLAQTQIGADASMANARAAAGASRYGADQNAATQAAALAQRGREFDANDLFRGQQADWGNMFGLGNMDLAYRNSDLNLAQFNAGQDQQQYQNMAQILAGLGGPQTNPLDVQGAYGLNQQAQQNAYNQQSQNAAQNRSNFWGGLGSIGSSVIGAWPFGGNGG